MYALNILSDFLRKLLSTMTLHFYSKKTAPSSPSVPAPSFYASLSPAAAPIPDLPSVPLPPASAAEPAPAEAPVVTAEEEEEDEGSIELPLRGSFPEDSAEDEQPSEDLSFASPLPKNGLSLPQSFPPPLPALPEFPNVDNFFGDDPSETAAVPPLREGSASTEEAAENQLIAADQQAFDFEREIFAPGAGEDGGALSEAPETEAVQLLESSQPLEAGQPQEVAQPLEAGQLLEVAQSQETGQPQEAGRPELTILSDESDLAQLPQELFGVEQKETVEDQFVSLPGSGPDLASLPQDGSSSVDVAQEESVTDQFVSSLDSETPQLVDSFLENGFAKSAAADLRSNSGLTPETADLAAAIADLASGTAPGTADLAAAIADLTAGTADLTAGTADLTAGTADLTAGTADLPAGTADLAVGQQLDSQSTAELIKSARLRLQEIDAKERVIIN